MHTRQPIGVRQRLDQNGGAPEARTKKKEVRAQQNKLSGYFNVSKEKESHETVLKLLDEMVFAWCASPEELISDLLESLLSSIRYDGTKLNVRSKHDGRRVSSKTLSE